MGDYEYRHQLRLVRARLLSKGSHPRRLDLRYCAAYARRHQLRVLDELAVSLGA